MTQETGDANEDSEGRGDEEQSPAVRSACLRLVYHFADGLPVSGKEAGGAQCQHSKDEDAGDDDKSRRHAIEIDFRWTRVSGCRSAG